MNIRIKKEVFLYLLLPLMLVTIILVAALVLFTASPNTQPGSLPTPTIFPAPSQGERSSIHARTVSPKEDVRGETIKNPSQGITFSLSQILLPKDVTARTFPSLPVRVVAGGTPGSIVVEPDPPDFWVPDLLYTVVLYDKQGNEITRYRIKVPRFRAVEVKETGSGKIIIPPTQP